MKVLAPLATLALFADVNGNRIVQKIFRNSVLSDHSTFEDRPATYTEGRVACEDGVVAVNGEEYDCKEVDFLSFISSEDLMIPGAQDRDLFHSSDIWGWRSPDEKTEVTILTLDTGVVMIDSTDPEDPCILAKSHSARNPSSWGDVKVFNNTAYTIKDKNERVDPNPSIGMEVYDLLWLLDLDCHAEGFEAPLVEPNFTGSDHGHCHNVVINTESSRVYSVGCRNVCNGGLVIFDIAEDRLHPEMIGCVDADNYTHDAQCVIYDGPDERYSGKEICIAFNEDTLTIWDVTDAKVPVMISRTGYANRAFTHQGWFNFDMTKILLDDELDEICNSQDPDIYDAECPELASDLSGELDTTTDIFIATDLENPQFETVIKHGTRSIDHNLYVWASIHKKGWGGNGPLAMIPNPGLAYLNNYMAGLRILDISNSNAKRWKEVGYFDITNTTEVKFLGVWSGYLHPSGVYAMSSIEKGIFFVEPQFPFVQVDEATEAPVASPPSPTKAPVPSDVTPFPTAGAEVEEEEEDPKASPALIVFLILSIMGVIGVIYAMRKGPAEEIQGSTEGEVKQATL